MVLRPLEDVVGDFSQVVRPAAVVRTRVARPSGRKTSRARTRPGLERLDVSGAGRNGTPAPQGRPGAGRAGLRGGELCMPWRVWGTGGPRQVDEARRDVLRENSCNGTWTPNSR